MATTNLTIEQIVEQANQTSDLRSKVMNELRSSIETQLIPAVCAVLNAYDKDCIYIKSGFKLITMMGGNEVHDCDIEDNGYCYSINNDGTISSYFLDYNNKNGELEWKESNVRSHIKFADCAIPKKFLTTFVRHTKSALESLNTRMQKQAKDAKMTLDDIEA